VIDPEDADFTLRAYVLEPLDVRRAAAYVATGKEPTPFVHAKCADERSCANAG
jgi:hypothetical protein